MLYFVTTVLFALILLPLLPVYKRVVTGQKAKNALFANLIGFVALCIGIMVFPFATGASAAEVASTATSVGDLAKGLGYIGAGLAVGLSGVGGGIAVSAAASAAIGAISENSKMLGKSLIFGALAESVALYGFVISSQILSAIK